MHKSNKGHLQMPHHFVAGDMVVNAHLLFPCSKSKNIFLLIHTHTHIIN